MNDIFTFLFSSFIVMKTILYWVIHMFKTPYPPHVPIRNLAQKHGFRRYFADYQMTIYVNNKNRVVVLFDDFGTVQISRDGKLIEELDLREVKEPLSLVIDEVFMKASTY